MVSIYSFVSSLPACLLAAVNRPAALRHMQQVPLTLHMVTVTPSCTFSDLHLKCPPSVPSLCSKATVQFSVPTYCSLCQHRVQCNLSAQKHCLLSTSDTSAITCNSPINSTVSRRQVNITKRIQTKDKRWGKQTQRQIQMIPGG